MCTLHPFEQGEIRSAQLKRLVRGLVVETDGQDLIEYALLAALIALAVITAMANLGGALNTKFGTIGSKLGGS